ncbi:MAG: amino acid ABC transporter permease [Methylobacteriaceae bacterium]|nr:amino acid ABC transporter permease [Methylobacteriaceae bacterium]MBV9246145.1 amino acid ABC transporter permease [Methylobacteriaceae bacterium]MBV9634839.1 amino acid ABC transporter permease [Methylobacteriaceae bacterium]
MRYSWDFGVVWEGLPFLFHGLALSVALSVLAMVAGSLIGLTVAILRVRRMRWLAPAGAAYVEFFKNTPLLAQILGVYYALPVVTGLRLDAFSSALIALSLNVGAFMSEVLRAGIIGVDRGQSEAASAIGLTEFQSYRRIILPQALLAILPACASIWLSLLKDTSVASVISVAELMYNGRTLAVDTYRPVEIFTVCGALYFIVVYVQSILLERAYQAWLARSRRTVVGRASIAGRARGGALP